MRNPGTKDPVRDVSELIDSEQTPHLGPEGTRIVLPIVPTRTVIWPTPARYESSDSGYAVIDRNLIGSLSSDAGPCTPSPSSSSVSPGFNAYVESPCM